MDNHLDLFLHSISLSLFGLNAPKVAHGVFAFLTFFLKTNFWKKTLWNFLETNLLKFSCTWPTLFAQVVTFVPLSISVLRPDRKFAFLLIRSCSMLIFVRRVRWLNLTSFFSCPFSFILEEPSFDPCYPIKAVRGQWVACLQSSRPMLYCYVSVTVSNLQRSLQVESDKFE